MDIENSEGADETEAEPKTNPDHRAIIADRDKAKAENKGLKSKLAEYEARDRKAAEERERAAGDFQAIEKRYQAQIADMQAQYETVVGERDGLLRGQRQTKIVDRLAQEAGIGNRTLLARLLPDTGLEDADPDAMSQRDVSEATKRLRKVAPELFVNTSTNKPPPVNGGPNLDRNDPRYWNEVGRRATAGGLPPAYAAATNRKG